MANSRVGAKIRTRTVAVFLGLYNNRSSIGVMNAAVFPDPVIALPQISLPINAMGIVCTCIGVGCTNPTWLKPFKIGRERFIDWNESTRFPFCNVSDSSAK